MARFLIPPEKGRPASPPPARTGAPRLGVSDIAWVARAALDRWKVLVALIGLVLAGLAYVLLASLGRVTGSAVWRAVLGYAGGALAYLVLAFTLFILARMVHFEARTGGVRTGAWDALKYAVKRAWTLSLVPAGLALAALMAVALLGLLAWLGKVFPTVFSFLFLIEFALGLVVVLMGAVLTWGLFLYPAIMTGESTDELETVRQYAGLYRRHGLALLGYEAAGVVLAWLAALVPSVAAVLGLTATAGVARRVAGQSFLSSLLRIPAAIRDVLHGWLDGVDHSINWLYRGDNGLVPGLEALLEPAGATGAGGFLYGLCGVFLGVSLLLIVAASLSYALVFFAAAGTRVYLAYAPPSPEPAAEQRAVA